jgi:hypothetical protein
MRTLPFAICLSAMVAACAQVPQIAAPAMAPPSPAVTTRDADVEREAVALRAALGHEVPQAVIDPPAVGRGWVERAQAAIASRHESILRPQLVVVVDRNPKVQQLRIVLARNGGQWQDLGGSRVSTGETGRRGYYLTPTGVFRHGDAILDWRAAGTFNAQHIRGLGERGMRVWDFGWQETARGWGTGEAGEIRLLMHATDPAYLEQRLGRPASKGCVRIPAAMNRFLDRRGILDADYERAARSDRRFAALLPPDRVPTPLAGDMMIVIDSAEPPRPGV